MQSNKIYYTKNLYAASYLVAIGYECELRFDNGVVWFDFPKDNEIEELVNAYYINKAQVDPHTMVNALKQTKDRLHNFKRAMQEGI